MKNKIVGVRVKIKNIYTLPLKSECKCFNAFTPTLTTKKNLCSMSKIKDKNSQIKNSKKFACVTHAYLNKRTKL